MDLEKQARANDPRSISQTTENESHSGTQGARNCSFPMLNSLLSTQSMEDHAFFPLPEHVYRGGPDPFSRDTWKWQTAGYSLRWEWEQLDIGFRIIPYFNKYSLSTLYSRPCPEHW